MPWKPVGDIDATSGVVAVATATAGTNTTQAASTAFVTTADDLKANLASPTFTGTTNVASPTAAVSNGVRQITMSTAVPTGGSDGDVWLVYV